MIISEEFEGALEEALEDVGKGVRSKSLVTLPPIPLVVKRTFLCGPVPSSLRSEPNSDPVTASTTDAHPQMQNPRSAVAPARPGSADAGGVGNKDSCSCVQRPVTAAVQAIPAVQASSSGISEAFYSCVCLARLLFLLLFFYLRLEPETNPLVDSAADL